MILEALDVYFAVALSKQGFKPFSTFGKLKNQTSAGGYRKHEPYIKKTNKNK